MSRRIPWLFLLVIAIELLAGISALVFKSAPPQVPEVNLSRLPDSTAAAIQQLQRQAETGTAAAWQELGEAYLAYGYFPAAEASLRYAVTLAPQSFSTVYAHAYSLDRLCRLPEAEAQLTAAAMLTGGRPEGNCWYHIGLSHLRREDAEQAERGFRRARDYPPAVHARARLMIRNGQSAGALPLLESLRTELPLDIQTEMLAVQASREQGELIALVQAAERAERSQQRLSLSDHWEYLQPIRNRYGMMARFARSMSLMSEGKGGQAADEYRALLDSEGPEYTDGMFEQGARLLLLAGQSDQALTILTRFQSRLSLSPGARHLLGDALANRHRIDEAIAQWESGNRLRPDDLVYQSLATVHRQQGEGGRADTELGLAALYGGVAAYRANSLSTAREELAKASRIFPKDPRPWFYLAEIELASLQIEKACALYQCCLEIDPNHGRAAERLSILRK